MRDCQLIETGGKSVASHSVAVLTDPFLVSTITLLFQDNRGGLELKDAESGEYLPAEPEEGAFVVNVGDMLQRFSNGNLTPL